MQLMVCLLSTTGLLDNSFSWLFKASIVGLAGDFWFRAEDPVFPTDACGGLECSGEYFPFCF